MEIAFSETAQKDIDFWKKSGNTAIQQRIDNLLSLRLKPAKSRGNVFGEVSAPPLVQILFCSPLAYASGGN
ncbi:MAG: hypothetical protein LBQ76_02695 [Candidatus Fibromonas sp.]|jgi:hypothetical protein|nr:hypothetical protein [Candidatus Fibromonas sp.]